MSFFLLWTGDTINAAAWEVVQQGSMWSGVWMIQRCLLSHMKANTTIQGFLLNLQTHEKQNLDRRKLESHYVVCCLFNSFLNRNWVGPVHVFSAIWGEYMEGGWIKFSYGLVSCRLLFVVVHFVFDWLKWTHFSGDERLKLVGYFAA